MAEFFVQLIKRVSEKEDVFTECVAAALRDDPGLARRFVLRFCGDNLDGVDVRTAAIDVGTQMAFPASTDVPACCIDMVLTRDGTTKVGIENKLFADEGPEAARQGMKVHFDEKADAVYLRLDDSPIVDS